MALPTFDAIAVGDTIPPVVADPISRTTLALYCGASGDHNPLHVDVEFANKAGLPDVIAHGMLSMAYLGRAITNWAAIERVRSYSVRFSSMTQVHDVVTCSGRITEKFTAAGENRVRLELETRTQSGTVTLKGEAIIAL